MKQINLQIGQFPNSNSSHCFAEEELKRLFYFAMPMCWRTNFINSGQSLHNSSIKTLKTYTVHQEHQTDAHQKRNKETNKSKMNNKNKRYNGGSRRNSRNNSSFDQPPSRNNNNPQSNKNKRKRLSNDLRVTTGDIKDMKTLQTTAIAHIVITINTITATTLATI